jgi:ligand-binding sensor domain-containing protein/anti-sigma regulatory factor (Ser/Thr protein kinase)
MTKTISSIFIWCMLLCTIAANAQQPAYTYYSIRDGLSSNDTYNCIEDKKGFLWIATENGVSRFDGKTFKNYSTAQGLPDNDILNVQMDNSGTIWVLPFQRTPAYYDEKKDKFINSREDAELNKIVLGNVNNANALTTGGMAFCNNDGSFYIYKNKVCNVFKISNTISYTATCRVIAAEGNKYLSVSNDSLRIFQNGKIIKRILLDRKIKRTAFVNNHLYIADSTSLHKINILANGGIENVKSISLPFNIMGLNFTGKQIAISSGSGNIYFIDTATLEVSPQGFSFNAFVRYIYEDKVGNTWICTRESGLIRYQQKGILTINEEAYQRNFNAICFWNNKLVAGTNDGQVYVYNKTYDYKIARIIGEKNYYSWIRQLEVGNKNLLVAAEGGLYKFDASMNPLPVFNLAKNYASKAFVHLNDSIIITGNSGGAKKMNSYNSYYADSARVRVTALEAVSQENIYIGSNTGLYKWEKFKKLIYLGAEFPILSNRVSSFAFNKADNILWTGLATDSLVALENDKPIAIIPLGIKLPGNECRTLYSKQKGVLWVGTNLVLARINYEVKNSKLDYKIAVFTTADGIAGKQINDIAERNDTIYVATNAGISMLPASLNFDIPDIPLFITGIKINNIDTSLQQSYNLNYKQNNIDISFSFADLGSTTERMYEYRINKGAWIKINIENIALQQLSPGSSNIQIRALKRDGTPSEIIASVAFKIETAFWKTWWFWLLVALPVGGLIFYITQQRNKIKREQSIQALITEKKLSELELRALKAQINPHFVFNCLNSIKFLNHQKRFEETDIYLDKFSYLLRKTLDFSGLQKIPLEEELAYSKNYLELEKLRLGEKLNYEIFTDESIDTKKTLVPPMLLQPYLENAVKHGIRHLPSVEGKVTIDTKKIDNKILCSITDNGVGIENAKALNKLSNPNHQSHGNTLQQRRAALYDVEVTTSNGENGVGTIVTLTLQNEQSI